MRWSSFATTVFCSGVIVEPPPRSARRSTGVVWPWSLALIILLSLTIRALLAFAPDPTAEAWLAALGFVPADVWRVLEGPRSYWLSTDTGAMFWALFVHNDWLHLVGNVAYLWVFGLAVERCVGNWSFLLMFLVLGGLANAVAAWHLKDANVLVIGASGGVSAIIGVYLGLFPARRIGLWLPLGLYLQFARVPALLVIGSWFALQLLYTVFGPTSTAVAWSAHVGGFLAGLLFALLLRLTWPRLDLSYRGD